MIHHHWIDELIIIIHIFVCLFQILFFIENDIHLDCFFSGVISIGMGGFERRKKNWAHVIGMIKGAQDFF